MHGCRCRDRAIAGRAKGDTREGKGDAISLGDGRTGGEVPANLLQSLPVVVSWGFGFFSGFWRYRKCTQHPKLGLHERVAKEGVA